MGLGRIHPDASQREQALCLEAMESTEFDAMTDEAWVRLCERVAKTAHDDATAAKAELSEQLDHSAALSKSGR